MVYGRNITCHLISCLCKGICSYRGEVDFFNHVDDMYGVEDDDTVHIAQKCFALTEEHLAPSFRRARTCKCTGSIRLYRLSCNYTRRLVIKHAVL